jgi:hypothetical protein
MRGPALDDPLATHSGRHGPDAGHTILQQPARGDGLRKRH